MQSADTGSTAGVGGEQHERTTHVDENLTVPLGVGRSTCLYRPLSHGQILARNLAPVFLLSAAGAETDGCGECHTDNGKAAPKSQTAARRDGRGRRCMNEQSLARTYLFLTLHVCTRTSARVPNSFDNS